MFWLMLLLVFLMLIRNGLVGFVVVGFVWLTAMTFNPNIDSGFVWVIALGLGYLMDSKID